MASNRAMLPLGDVRTKNVAASPSNRQHPIAHAGKGIVEVAVDGAIEALDGTLTTVHFKSIVK